MAPQAVAPHGVGTVVGSGPERQAVGQHAVEIGVEHGAECVTIAGGERFVEALGQLDRIHVASFFNAE